MCSGFDLEGMAAAIGELEDSVEELRARVVELEADDESPDDPDADRCEAITKSGARCPKDAEYEQDGKSYCKTHCRMVRDGTHDDAANAAAAAARAERRNARALERFDRDQARRQAEWEAGRPEREAAAAREAERRRKRSEVLAARRLERAEAMGEERCAAVVVATGARCPRRRLEGARHCKRHTPPPDDERCVFVAAGERCVRKRRGGQPHCWAHLTREESRTVARQNAEEAKRRDLEEWRQLYPDAVRVPWRKT